MPSLDAALLYARKLPRFRYRSLGQKVSWGPFVPQFSLPIATRAQVNHAGKTNIRGNYNHKILWVRVADLKSEQMALARHKLIWHLKNYAKMQREKRYPGVIFVKGVPILWDGNHRASAARLLGKKFMRCNCYFEKKRLTHG